MRNTDDDGRAWIQAVTWSINYRWWLIANNNDFILSNNKALVYEGSPSTLRQGSPRGGGGALLFGEIEQVLEVAPSQKITRLLKLTV